MTRRSALASLGAGLALWPSLSAAQSRNRAAPGISFAFSTYGMRALPLPRALRVCADIGYSGVELACMPGWPCDPAALTAMDRRDIRRQLSDLSLDLPCLMENWRLAAPPEVHRANLERLQVMGQLAHDLRGDGPTPVIETVLGGRPDEWPQVRDAMAQALGDWERVAAQAQVVVAIKAHVSGALHRPEDTIRLVRQVNSPWIKAVYDYSHFERQGIELGPSLRLMLPETVFIHIKDSATNADGKTEFVLPGDGMTNYNDYLKQLVDGNYRGAVCVEVSAQVSTKPGYNPIIAAERCYMNLRGAFEQAGLRARA